MLICTAAQAADIYVDAVLGDNTRTTAEAQNPATPWKCLTVAATGAAVGDTVHVAPGYYLAATGEAFPLTITGRYFISTETGLATIDAKTSNVNTINMGAGATLEGFTVINAAPANYYYTIYTNAADVHILNCTIKEGYGAAQNRAIVVDAGGDRVSIEGNSITTTTWNTSSVLTFSNGADNPIIRNNIIYGPGGQTNGIEFGTCVSPTVEGNTITVGYYGIRQTGTSTNQNILNNKIIAVGTNNNYGFYVDGTAATAITGTISGNEFRGWSNSAGSSGIRIENTNANYTISKNTLVKNTNGVRVGAGTATVRDNIISAAPRNGTYLSGSTGIYQSGGTVTSTYNNLFNNITTYYGTIGSQSNDNTSNPRFVNPDGNDYRLFTDSPCKNTASDGGNRGAYAATDTTSSITTESYVDDGGSDVTGDGTLGNPWKTVTKGLGSTEGTVYVRAGTYNAANGESFPLVIAAGQKLRNYLTEIATVDASTTSVNTIDLANSSTLEGVTVNNSSANYAVSLAGADALIKNNAINQNGSGIAVYYAAAADRCSLEGNAITNGASGSNVLYLVSAADNPIIRNNTLIGQKTSSAYVIYFTGTSSYPTIESNTITGAYYAIRQDGACTNQNILNNKITASGTNNYYGMMINGASTGTIASNEVSGWNSQAGSAGIYIQGAATITISKNTIVKNTTGVYASNGTINIQNSIISAAPRPGSFLTGSVGINRAGGTVNSTYNDLYNNLTNYSGTVGNQANDITSNPRFVNADGNDYRLYNDSPCKATASDGGNRGAYAATDTTSSITTESYVDDGGSDVAGDGTLGNPWKSITKGLGSTEGTVNVRAGTYTAGESFPLRLANGQKLKGYLTEVATIDSSTTAIDTVQMANSSTLEGVTVNNSSANYAVSLAGADALIKNNAINQNGSGIAVYYAAAADRCSLEGNALTAGASAGYGIYLVSAADNPIIRNNTIVAQKTSSSYGIYFAGTSTSPTIEGNTITANYYGIYQSGACTNQNIWSNKILAAGSSNYYGIYIGAASTGIIATNEVRGWNSQASSAGIYISNASANLTLEKNTIAKCRVGVDVTSGTVKVINSIIASEIGGYSGTTTKGIDHNGGTATSRYNDLYANDITYEGTVGSQTGDLQVNPLFVDATNNDVHLTSTSPCIDAGDPASPLDPDGTRADMGEYYYNQTNDAPTVTLLTPSGGQSLTGGASYNITWAATQPASGVDHVDIYYSTNSGSTYPNLIVAGTSNDGTHSWSVPTINSTTDRVRVIAVSGVGVLGTGESSSDFSITTDSQGPTVEVTSPIGGELWKGGDTHNITFTVTDEAGLLANSLYAWYSTDGGTTFPNVITREADITSPFVWVIPASINSQTVRVRLNLWDAYNNIGTGESPASFTIDSTPPSVTVSSPSGGEKWQGGIDHNLTWTATDNFTLEANPITLQYSTNSGTDYTNIATGEANDGTYSWATPSTNTNEARVKIRAQDVCGNIGSAEGSNFIIDITAPSAPTLITPANSSTTNDATTTFTWNASTDNLSGIASYEVIIDTNVVTIDATTNYTTPDALSEGVHTWKVKAKDGAGIWGSYSDTWSFTVDITTPEVASITLRDRTNGSTQYTNELTVSVEANGVTGVPVSMRLAQDAAFTQNATAWLAYSAQTEYTLTAGEGSRSVYYKVRDAATNESSVVNQSITVDTVSPGVESILLKDLTTGSTLESNSLTVTVEAYGVSAEATQMRIAQNSSFTTNSTGWVTYAPTTEYTFTAGEGARTAYYQVRDPASNESNIVNRSITIDTSGPSAAGIALKDRIYGSTQYANNLTISLEVHDATGSPTQRRTAQDTAFTVNDTGWLTYATTSEYTFTAGEDSRTAYFKMRDSAQNESGAYNTAIVIDTVPPSQVTLLTPANNSYTNDTTPTFTWNAATDVTSGVASYEVVIDVTQIATLGAVTTYTTPDAESQGLHNWKARAKDHAQNWGAYSTTWNLTIETTNPTVILGKPRGGQTLEATGNYNITWEAADNFGLKTNPVTLYFSSNAGASWSTIQSGIAYVTGEGTYSWTIPNVNSTQCRVSVEVEDLAGNRASNMSPTNFTISNVQPTATVLYPNGGEYLKGNTSYNITWAATGEVAPVTINLRYSTNSGSVWTLITTNETNDGTYGWTTPAVDSTTARVSVEAVDGLGRVGTDQSAANFSIDSTTPEVAVVAPNGGERLAGGSSYNIQWTAADVVGLRTNPITLRYSTDSGINWAPIATAQPNTPPYAWTVPLINSTTVRVSVEATDQVGYTGTDQSASDFIIDSTTPTVTTITPTNGATSVPLDTQVIIVFSKEMSREVTQNAFSLSASPAVSGSYSWSSDGKTLTFTPAAVLEYNTLYTVGVAATATDMAGNHLTAFSSTFTTAQRGDTESPHIIIQRVDSQGVANTLKDGDYIPKQPRFKGIITDNLGVSRATIKFYLDDVETAATITEITAIRYEVAYTVTSNLEGETVRTHSVKLIASDTAGNSTTKEITGLKVSYDTAKVIGPVLTYPTTYNPLTGQPALLAYNLTADQDVMIYMLDISGQNVWTGKYLSGTEGGKAGYNEVLFYGRSEISGTFLGNGIYIYKLVANNRVIGTGRLAIF